MSDNEIKHVDSPSDDYKPISYEIIPSWGMVLIFLVVLIHTLATTDKWKMIAEDFKEPRFLIILLVVCASLFLVKDSNPKRASYANDNAILAGLSAYFGHLDMPLMAFFLAGIYSYYTFREFKDDTPGNL